MSKKINCLIEESLKSIEDYKRNVIKYKECVADT